MPTSCINLSLSTGQTPYIASVASPSSYSVTSFAPNGIIYINPNCPDNPAPNGYYYNGSIWAVVTNNSGIIAATGNSVFNNYQVLECGGSTSFVLSASTDTLTVGNTYLIEYYDTTYGFTQMCVTIIPFVGSPIVYQQSKPSELTVSCDDCNARSICSAGLVTAGDYVYYYDCCENYTAYTVSTTTTINFNPSLSHSTNIVRFATAGYNPCITPSPTPTNTPTPSFTPTQSVTPTHTSTPTPTPSFTPPSSPIPVFVYDNNCSVINSIPMTIQCQVTNTTTSTTNNGAITILVNGGISPYSFYWNTGARTRTINNLLPGNYTCTVIDYYGDYTATTTCSVVAPTPNCNLNGIVNQIFETPTPTPTVTQTMTPTLTITPTKTTTPTPTLTKPLEKVKLIANGTTSISFPIFSSTTYGYRIVWSGNTFTDYPVGNNSPSYTYSSPYTGDIFIESLDLSTIKSIQVDATPIVSVTWTTSEFTKLDGLILATIEDGVRLNGIASELPRTLTYFVTIKNNLSGSTFDLPTGLTNTTIGFTNRISGSTYGLPRGLTYLNIEGNNQISGDVAGLPTGLTQAFVGNNTTISGNTIGLPRNLAALNILGTNTVFGSTFDLPTGLTYCSIIGNNTISGNTLGLPTTLQSVYIYGDNTISGNFSGLPTGLINMELLGSNKVGGNISTLPNSLINIYLRGSGTTLSEIPSGNIANLPPSSEVVYIFSNNVISGDAANTPVSVVNLTIGGNNTISAYTYPHVWAPVMNQLSIFGNVINNSTFVDNLLIDLTGSSWSGLKNISLRGISSSTATSAINYLNSLGVTTNITSI